MLWVERLVLLSLLALAAAWDWRKRIVPNKLVLAGMAMGIVLWALRILGPESKLSFFHYLAGGCGGFLLHLAAYSTGKMGAGDVKLGGVLGWLMGWETWGRYLWSYGLSLVILVMILYLLPPHKRPVTIPLAPMMALGYLLHLFLELRL